MTRSRKRKSTLELEVPKIKTQKGPKTLKGKLRKLMTGDGRRKTPAEKATEEAIEAFVGKEWKKKLMRRWRL